MPDKAFDTNGTDKIEVKRIERHLKIVMYLVRFMQEFPLTSCQNSLVGDTNFTACTCSLKLENSYAIFMTHNLIAPPQQFGISLHI